MAILVTGGAGFVGSHLIDRLLAECTADLVCLDNFNDFYDPRLKRANAARWSGNARVEVVEGSFCDALLVGELFASRDLSVVIHLGGYAGVRYSVDHPKPYQHANVEGTLVLLEAARERPLSRFIYASSSTVYGAGAEPPFREDGILGVPKSPYGATKRSAELLCLTYHQLFQIPAVCLRFFSVYGPRLRPDLALSVFTRAIEEGTPLPLFGDGTVERDFTHVRDICSGIIGAIDAADVEGECINLGHDEPIEVNQVIAAVERAAGKTAMIDHRPARAEDMRITHADISKAKRLLKYQPTVDFAEGVAEFVDWYRAWHSVGQTSV